MQTTVICYPKAIVALIEEPAASVEIKAAWAIGIRGKDRSLHVIGSTQRGGQSLLARPTG
jgi:hypothetical protein